MVSKNLRAISVLWAHYYRLFGARAMFLVAYRVQRRMPFLRWTLRALWWRLPGVLSRRPDKVATPKDPQGQYEDRRWFSDRFPDALEQKLTAADRIFHHQFSFLGTGMVAWGDPIDWHHDVKSGQRWPARFYADYVDRELMPGDGVDVKVPWELSRLHHLVTLAQAWRLTDTEVYSAAFFAQWESWAQTNSAPYGINWTSAMEVAIRSVNLSWSQRLLSDAPGWTDSRRSAFLGMLRQHGIFIERNLEVGVQVGQIVAGNHYLANMSGLACLGLSYTAMPEAKRWRIAGLKALEEEMQRQVLADGFFFESSTGYHRLAIELFLLPALLARTGGHEMSSAYWSRLEMMMDVVLHLTRPDGQVPQIGDNDDGRLLILSGYPDWPRHDHRYLLALGAALFGRPDFKAAAGGCAEEIFWLLGRDGVNRFDSVDADDVRPGSRAFTDAGLYVIRSADGRDHATIRAGAPTPQAPNAHAHSDALSLELWVDGRPVFVDRGAYCYTSDPDSRNLFRSTMAHNTATFDGREASHVSPLEPFSLGRDAKTRVVDWNVGPDQTDLIAESHGNEVPGSQVLHRRSVRYREADAEWAVIDELSAKGEHTAVLSWHGPPKTPMQVDEAAGQPGRHIGLNLPQAKVALEVGPDALGWSYALERSDYSPAYGARVPSDCLRVSVTFRDRCTLSWSVRRRSETAGYRSQTAAVQIVRSVG